MRTVIKVSERRKKQIIQMATLSNNMDVVGVYYEGCTLVQYSNPNQKTILAIK
jgi:predicted Zn-dependent protease with MMP-like domain